MGKSKPRRPRKRRSYKISAHFSQRDFECRCGQCEASFRISLGLVGGLEFLRSHLKQRVTIVKGYQCPESSEKKGKLNRNYHAIGVAADIKVDKTDLMQLFEAAQAVPEFKGIGINIEEDYLHVDTRKEDERLEWVIKKGEKIDFTEKNREELLNEAAQHITG